MTPQHSDALAEHQAEATKWALSVEGMLLHKFELAIHRVHSLDVLEKPRDASIKAASDNYHATKAALIEAIKALQAKAVRE